MPNRKTPCIRKAGKAGVSGSKLARMAAAGALTLRGRVRSRK